MTSDLISFRGQIRSEDLYFKICTSHPCNLGEIAIADEVQQDAIVKVMNGDLVSIKGRPV